MNPGYGIDSIGGYNYWNDILSNQWFQRALMSPNVNFKGYSDSQTDANQGATGTNAATGAAATANSDGSIPVSTPAAESSDGPSFGTIATIGGVSIAAAGALYYMKHGNLGKAGECVKSIFKGNKSSSGAVDALKRLTAVKNKNGEMRFMIPGKTTTVSGQSAINELTDRYGIETAIQGERLVYKPTSSVIESFRYSENGENFVVHINDGEITRIVDKDGQEVLKRFTEAQEKSAEASTYEKMTNALRELAKEEKDVDKNLLNNTIGNIQYVNTFGDDVLKVSMERYGADPRISQFTTLQRFAFEDAEMQALKLQSDERVFAESAKNGLLTKKGKLAEGLRVATFSKKVDGTNEYFFEGKRLVKIKKADGTELPEGSAGYIELANKYEKDINKLVRKVYEDRTEVPVGATIIPE